MNAVSARLAAAPAPLRAPAARGASTEVSLIPVDSSAVDTLAGMESRIFGAEAWPREAFADYLQQSGIVAAVAMLAGHPVGYVLARVHAPETGAANIDSVGVLPEARGHRVGETLMKHALDEVRDEGARRCTLQVKEDNAPALKLYDRLGFHVAGRLPGYYHGEDGLQMTLDRLPAAG